MPQAFLPNCWQQVWHFGVCFPIRSGLNGPAAAVAVAVAVDCSALCTLVWAMTSTPVTKLVSFLVFSFFSVLFVFLLLFLFLSLSLTRSQTQLESVREIQFNSIALIGIFCGFVMAILAHRPSLLSLPSLALASHCLLLLMLISYPTSIL